jgi:hypothetical protein
MKALLMVNSGELAAWVRDLSRTAKALQEIFSPDNVHCAI